MICDIPFGTKDIDQDLIRTISIILIVFLILYIVHLFVKILINLRIIRYNINSILNPQNVTAYAEFANREAHE